MITGRHIGFHVRGILVVDSPELPSFVQRDPDVSARINAYLTRNGAFNGRLEFIYFPGFRIQAAYAIVGILREPDATATVDREAVRPDAFAGLDSIWRRVKRELA